MNTKENFAVKYLYRAKVFSDYLLQYTLKLCIVLALGLIPYWFTVAFYNSILVTKISFTMKNALAYLRVLGLVAVAIFCTWIFFATLFSLLHNVIFRAKNRSLSKEQCSYALKIKKEQDLMIITTLFCHILQAARRAIIISFCIIVPIICLPFLIMVVTSVKPPFTLNRVLYIAINLIISLAIISAPSIAFCLIISHKLSQEENSLIANCLKRPSPYNSLSGINFDTLSGVEFEQYCSTLLSYLGYSQIALTAASHDQGVDLTAYKDDCKYAIQCKRYRNHVGNSAVQEVVAGMRMYNCNRAIVITNSFFTSAAIDLARANQVELIDRKKLFSLLKQVILTTSKSTKN